VKIVTVHTFHGVRLSAPADDVNWSAFFDERFSDVHLPLRKTG
jgi:hypothetical protein